MFTGQVPCPEPKRQVFKARKTDRDLNFALV